MLLHLEGGFCCVAQLYEEDVTDIAIECYGSRRYLSSNPSFPFECPTCGTEFRVMSALLQHAESEACSEDPCSGPLAKFLTYLRKRCR